MERSQSTIQFISQTKLEELARQRERLLAQYQTLLDESRAAAGAERLRILREGLGRVGLKSTRPSLLHRNLPNLKALLAGQSVSEELFTFWATQLEGEVERGSRRAETVYVFGALLGEWDDAADAELLREQAEAHKRLLDAACSEPPPAARDIFSKLLGEFAGERERVSQSMAATIAGSESGLLGGWHRLANGPSVPAHVRQEAERFAKDGVLERQLNDALAVATRDPSSWSWPEQGVESWAIWTRNKWRMYPSLSLVEYAIADGCAAQWTRAMDDNFSSIAHIINRQGRINKLRELNAPEVIFQNELRMLKKSQESVHLGWYESVDPWTGRPTLDGENVGGIVSRRAREQVELRDGGAHGYYDAAVIPMVRLVNAELRVLQAAFPDQPLHVAKLDVANYFADVSHDVLLAMLNGLGMTEDGIAFVRQFLRTPWLQDGSIRVARRGVPMDQDLSHWLCEMLLRLLERHVLQQARVRIIRQIDDICLMAPEADELSKAWHAVRAFLADVGLSVRENKCGAVTLNGGLIDGLAASPPYWGMMQLESNGGWTVHQPSFDAFLETTRDQINARHSVFSRVLAYNEHLKFLTTALGLAMDLGDAHREAANAALLEFESNLFGDGQGIVAEILKTISERYTEHAVDLPESWLAWPVTAGGLGLRLAGIIRGQYQLAYEQRAKDRKPAPSERPDDWQWNCSEWTGFYEDQLESLEPAECEDSARIKELVNSFIRRGKSISGGQQEGLSQYWRWVLSTQAR